MTRTEPETPAPSSAARLPAVPETWPYTECLPPRAGLLVVLAGPSAVGKDALIDTLRQRGFPVTKIVTAPTRAPRPGEVDGRDYWVLSRDEFARWIEDGKLLEWANVYGTPYGTPVAEVRRALARGEVVLLKIDVQGAAQVKAKVPEAIFIYLGPESVADLEQRLVRRGTETEEAYQTRLAEARAELQEIPRFDYLVINRNGQLDRAADQVEAIVTSECLRVHPRQIQLPPD